MENLLLFNRWVWRIKMRDERRVMPTRAVNGFIAIPVLQSTKLVGIECLTTAPVSGSFALYSTWSGCTDATLNSVTIQNVLSVKTQMKGNRVGRVSELTERK